MRREQGRRRLRFFLTIVGILIVAAGGWGITRSPLLTVRHVRITGSSQTPVAAVRAAAGLAHHRQMVDLDPGAMSRAVGALPWVNTVKVRRHWPSTVSLTITERRPVAATADRRGGWAVVDATGRVLAVVGVSPVDLPTDPDGQVELSLKTGATALLGRPDGLPDKLTALITMLAKAQVGKAIVDVRVPTAPVLTAPSTGR